MHIAIDVREACRTKRTGKGTWTYGLVTALLEHKQHTFSLLSDQALPDDWQKPHVNAIVLSRGTLWHVHALWYLRVHRPSCYLSTTSYIVPAFLTLRIPCFCVVHDLIAFQPGKHDHRARLIERTLLRRVVHRSAGVVCISASTKHDLIHRFQCKQTINAAVVYAGPLVQHPVKGRMSEKTIVCIGTLSPRKNQKRLIQAYTMLPQDLQKSYTLLLAGNRGWDDDDIIQLARKTPGVTWEKYVTEERYNALLTSCTLFALPSLYEGFGLQILDALQRGIPVLTSDRGSLQEVAGSAAHLVDPEDTASIAAGMERLLTDEQLRHDLCSRGPIQAAMFSWQRTAEFVLDALDLPRL